MDILRLTDLPLSEKKVLVRVDMNVPLTKQGTIADTTRIEASLPTIRHILTEGGSPILLSHLGRPKGQREASLSLQPIAHQLNQYLNRPVLFLPACIGEEVRVALASLRPGEIALLENLRFYRAEEDPESDPSFAKELASFGDLYINDAFGSSHRTHSSTYVVPRYFPGRAAAGFLLIQEITYLQQVLIRPTRPFHALVGGSKISSKIGLLQTLASKVDRLLIGGGMAFTFLAAQQKHVGRSLVESSHLPMAKELLKTAGERLVLPLDIVAAPELNTEAQTRCFTVDEGIPPTFHGADIGPLTVKKFASLLSEARTILWNGPMGVYEIPAFAAGTLSLIQSIASLAEVTSVIGGGDLVAAVHASGLSTQFSHISTGGGATLEYIEQGSLPALTVLSPRSLSK